MLREYLSNIADKFRTYLDTTEPINAQDFAGKVEDVAVRYNQLGFTNGYNLGLEEGKPLGKLELLQDSEYMNAKVSGTAIAVNDVNAVEHSVGCYLTSDTITDFSGIEVSRYGKNLFDKDFASVISNWTNHIGGYKYIKVFVGKGNTVTVSYQQDLVTGMDCPYTMIRLSPDGESDYWIYHQTVDGLINKKATVTSIEDYIYVRANVFNDETRARFMQYIGNDLQIEINPTATPYTPYIEPVTYTAKSDGTVEGVTSISPNMTLLSNNNGVVINANYLRDIDTYIDNLITDVALTGGE